MLAAAANSCIRLNSPSFAKRATEPVARFVVRIGALPFLNSGEFLYSIFTCRTLPSAQDGTASITRPTVQTVSPSFWSCPSLQKITISPTSRFSDDLHHFGGFETKSDNRVQFQTCHRDWKTCSIPSNTRLLMSTVHGPDIKRRLLRPNNNRFGVRISSSERSLTFAPTHKGRLLSSLAMKQKALS